MKQSIALMTVAATLTLGITVAFGYTAPAGGLVGSKHDMNTLVTKYGITKDSQDRVCAFCHTPHHKVDSTSLLTYNPLWSHTINNKTYTAYVSPTFNTENSIADPLIGPSRLCMSCHDGVIAVDQHYGSNTPNTSGTDARTSDLFDGIAVGKASVTTPTVGNTHPIGFDLGDITQAKYPFIRQDLNTNNGALAGKKLADLGYKENGKNYMTCASCHDVHNRENTGTYFLYDVQAGSAICLMCHDK
jgi:hypothetical protein